MTIVRGVDAQGVEDRRAEVVGADGIAGRIGGPAVGGAEDVTAADAGSGQDGRVTVRPVLAAAVGLGDPGRAAELADPDDQRLVEQAARARGRRAGPRNPGRPAASGGS